MDRFRIIACTNCGILRIVTEETMLDKGLYCKICKKTTDQLNLDTPEYPKLSEIMKNTKLGNDIINDEKYTEILKEKIVEYVKESKEAFPEMPLYHSDIARNLDIDNELSLKLNNELIKEKKLMDDSC